MYNSSKLKITQHALKRFRERYSKLYPNRRIDLLTELQRILRNLKPEKPRDRRARWELFKRSILHGKSKTYVTNDGWRVVVVRGNTIVTIERVDVSEN